MLKKTAFLILSCDAYSELWPTFFRQLDRYWPDCPFQKYLLTNLKESGRKDIQAIQVGSDITWSSNLRIAINRLTDKYEYLLVTFDDLFLVEKVDNRRLKSALKSFSKNKGEFLQLIKWHNKPKRVDDQIGLIEKGSLYRPNCVYAIWNMKVLKDLLVTAETAWQFERNGSSRSDKYDGFFAVNDSIFHYNNVVIRGEIRRKYAIEYNLLSVNSLKIMTVWKYLLFKLRYYFFRISLFIIPKQSQFFIAKLAARR